MSEKSETVRFQLRLQGILHERLGIIADENGVSINQLINQIIGEYVFPTPEAPIEHISEKVNKIHTSLIMELQEIMELRKSIAIERKLLQNI